MRRLIALVFSVVSCFGVFAQQGMGPGPGVKGYSGGAAFNEGFNFRATSGFVTDGTDDTFVLTSDTYPTTRAGVTFGWETTSGLDSRDRSSGVDARLAGMHFKANDNTSTITFRVDLPSTGDYSIRLAIGDATGGNSQVNYVTAKDNSTAFITLSPISTDGDHYGDAAGNLPLEGDWAATNVAVTRTFASTIMRVTLGGTVDSASSTIAHLKVVKL